MNTSREINDQPKLFLVSLPVLAHADLFTQKPYKEAVVQALEEHLSQQETTLYAWVIMTNELYLVAATLHEPEAFTDDLKTFTSKALEPCLLQHAEAHVHAWTLEQFLTGNGHGFSTWAPGRNITALITNKHLLQAIASIHQAPVAAGYVERDYEYLYSSARDYAGTSKGLLQVSFADDKTAME